SFLASHRLDANQLVTVWGGANDFLHANVTDPSLVANNLGIEITALAAAGGKFFLVPNLPQLGNLPATSSLPALSQAQLNGLTQAFNAQLTTTLNQLQTNLGITVYRVDVDNIVQSARLNPAAFGFTNVTQDVIDTPALAGNATGYLFWDSVHPTTAGQAIVGNAAFSAVPEPSSVVLLVIAGGCLAVPGVRARRRSAPAR
ncbi:MAG: PEP-CTERM sorting domain-containing protein, partial [Planctomycetia bacterium]|nr:PEP-CTERM sorting domain-containing protein [Planctomycetia bacterium]